ncbi:MAG: tyrosine-type recombinase/integrase family protein, partial [Alphaproteobacteria bacterium]|nr:tyrosine-type recombinase/integrase family protein [Alphaproteobacteria bacterium]
MRTYSNITETTLRRKPGEQTLTILDRSIPAFGLRVAPNGTRTFFVRVARKLRTESVTLGTADDLTAAKARAKALAEIEAARVEGETGPLMADFADDFMRRLARRWKPATQESNRHLIRNHILPFFRETRVADITRAHVRRWFDGLSERPGTANRALPVLSVMMRQAELWELRPQGSNPCRNMRRYKRPAMERFLSAEELKRLGFVLDHADDALAASAIRLLLFTGARSSEIIGLRWDWIHGTRVVLPDSKTGPKTVQLPPPARAALNTLPRSGRYVFPDARGDGPMSNFNYRWQRLR